MRSRGRSSRRGLALAVTLVTLGSVARASAEASVPSAQTAPPPSTPDSTTPGAGDVVVTTTLTPTPAYVGDLLTYSVSAGYPSGLTINLPIGVRLGAFEIVDVQQGPPESTGDGFRRTFTFTLQVFELGALTVPAFELTVVDGAGEVQTVPVPATAAQIDALTVNEPAPERRGEERPVSPAFPNDTAAWTIYGLLLAMLAGLAGWSLHRRFGGAGSVPAGPPPIPPDQIALEALTALARRRAPMLEEGAFADYYLELTDIAKGYVEGRFGVAAMDRTTDELRVVLGVPGSPLGPIDVDEFLSFLDRCDLVKFARVAPAMEETEDDLRSVRAMVESTEAERARRAEQAAQAASSAAAAAEEEETS